MARLLRLTLAATVLACAAPALAADFDATANGLALSEDALRTMSFEDATATSEQLRVTTWQSAGGFLPVLVMGDSDAKAIEARQTARADALEGRHGLRLGDGSHGVAFVDDGLFASLEKKRLEVTFWARVEGTSPAAFVAYDRDPKNFYRGGRDLPFASVRAIRTGRETSDGWAEYSTGTIDGSVWGARVVGVVIAPSMFSSSEGSFVLDAVEIHERAGRPVEATSCTMQTVEAACGPEGDCMYGRCVSSTVTWGPHLGAAHRAQIAARWNHLLTRVIGDRNSAAIAREIVTPVYRRLAESAASSRHFLGGLNRLVNLVRDNHTSFGSASNLSYFAPQVSQGSSSGLGACFGVVDKDLLGGGLGFAVFRAHSEPLSGVELRAGDLVVAIDGREPKEWLSDTWAHLATTHPNDPASDWSSLAADLSSLVTARARTVTLLRCGSDAACDEGNRQVFTVDIATRAYARVVGDLPERVGPSQAFACTPRFRSAVEVDPAPNTTGEDAIVSAPGVSGELRAQFDGFVGQQKWRASMRSVFAPENARVLVDARVGHGGYYDTVEFLFNLLRGTSEPMGVVSAGRGAYDAPDPPWILPAAKTCATGAGDEWTCFRGSANGFFTTQASPAAASTRVAWVNSIDVSANDFMPRLIKGRSNVRIFSPHPTSGAFGAVSSLPSFVPGMNGASIQIQDARFADSLDGIDGARWESGHGVAPDVVVVQKLSDTLRGVDTLLVAATDWLVSP